jgi:hypothetical protein
MSDEDLIKLINQADCCPGGRFGEDECTNCRIRKELWRK